MKYRKYRLRPPTSSSFTTGEVLTFAPSDNAPHPSKLVELTPAGPEPLVLTFKATGVKGTEPSNRAAERRAAFLVELNSCGILSHYHNPANKRALNPNQWDD